MAKKDEVDLFDAGCSCLIMLFWLVIILSLLKIVFYVLWQMIIWNPFAG